MNEQKCQSDLKGLNQDQLIERFHKLVQFERKTMAALIECLKEIDRRKTYLSLGYGSIFAYLTEGLGYSTSSAMRRISAARLVQIVPEAQENLKNGALNLMQMSVVAQGIRQKEKEGTRIEASQKKAILSKIKSLDFQSTQKVVAQELNLKVQSQELTCVQADESVRITCTLTAEQSEKIDQARQLLSHKYPGANWAELITAFAEDVIRLRDPRRPTRKYKKKSEIDERYSTKSPNSESDVQNENTAGNKEQISTLKKDIAPAMCKQSSLRTSFAAKMAQAERQKIPGQNFLQRKRIPSATRREVHKDFHTCQYVDLKTQRKCNSRFQLQIDHIQPIWAGGQSSIENLQILCAQHNRHKYRKEAGLA